MIVCMKPASNANIAGISVEDFEKHQAITAPKIETCLLSTAVQK